MNNDDIAQSWALGEKAGRGALHTGGENLYSYALLIGYTEDGVKYMIEYTIPGGKFYSVTTSTHVGLGIYYADVVHKPEVIEQ